MYNCLRKICLFMTCIFILGFVAGCNSSTSALGTKKASENSETKSENTEAGAETADGAEGAAAEAEQKELAKIINKPGKVKNRGGYIKILVNKSPITNYDIQRRIKFLQLRRAKGNRAKIAEQELIEQAVKLQEAKRLRSYANDTTVDTAFANFAKQNRTNPANLSRELGRMGIGGSHFKEFIRTQISWRNVNQRKFQSEHTQTSERDVVTQLRKSGSSKPEVTEYNIQQIVFVLPAAKRNKNTLAARRQEALAFRQRFTACENSLEQAKLLRDVSVIDRKRLMEPELPVRWKDEIVSVDGNGTTRLKETEKGIELMAICSKRVVSDDRAAQVTKQSAAFEDFNTKGSEISQQYLDELMKKSVIIYQ